MKYIKFGFFFFLSIFVCFVPSILFAYDSSKEHISGFVSDTGDMNEREADRKFSGSFTVKTKSADPKDYKIDGNVKNINVAVYVSWKNNGVYSKIYTGSFTPVDSNNTVVGSKNFSFSYKNPSSWTNPMKVIVVAQFNAVPADSPQTTYNGRGDISSNNVETPPALADVSLGYGSTYYEGLKSFDGSLGEVDIKTGSVRIKFEVLVTIFQNPLAGAYDPTPEGVAVFADLNGGTNPTTSIYGETKLAGLYWNNSGIRPKLPFDLPFNGSWLAGPNVPGVIVGGTAMAWGAVPILGQNTTWGEQNRHVWYLPPKSISFTPEFAANAGENTFEIYDGCSFGGQAQVLLRKLQIEARVNGFKWIWGDGNTDNSDLINGKLISKKSHVYKLANPLSGQTFKGNCSIKYQNSTNHETTLEYPFDVKVKPLPTIHVPTEIAIYKEGETVAYPGEDVYNSIEGIGSQKLTVYEGYTNNYEYYFTITDSSSIYTSPKTSPKINYIFTTLGKKTIKLYVKYRKGLVENNKLVDKGWQTHLCASRDVWVESQQVMEGDSQQRITFTVTPEESGVTITSSGDYYGYKCIEKTLSVANPKASIKFNGSANIFYARRDENSTLELDQKSGVRPGSVAYRWRIIDADGNDAYQKGYVTVSNSSLVTSFTKIADKGTKIEPIVVTFNTPFGRSNNQNRFYKVFLEAKYKELAWQPVYSGSKITDWKDDLGYKNNNVDRYIIYSPTNLSYSLPVKANNTNDDFRFCSDGSSQPPLTKEGSNSNKDLLYDGSLGWLVRIKDKIPAKVFVTGPVSGFTGDPLTPSSIKVKVYDNNPDTYIKDIQVLYKRFDSESYKISSEMTSEMLYPSYTSKRVTTDKLESEKIIPYYFISAKNDEKETEFVFGTLDEYKADKSKIALYNHYSNLNGIPNSFAKTMKTPKNCEVSKEGVFTYKVKADIDDWEEYSINTVSSISITDNDAPVFKISLVNPVTGVPSIFEISGGLNDPLPNYQNLVQKITLGDKVSSKSISDPNNASTVIKIKESFVAVAHQRFLCSIEVTDNVLPNEKDNFTIEAYIDENGNKKEIKAYLKDMGSEVYKSENPEYLFYMKPGNYTMKFTVKDKSGMNRILEIPLEIVKEKDAKMNILKQENEK